MSDTDQLDHFSNDVDNLVDRYRKEYDMTYASVIGILHMKIHDLTMEANDAETDS